MVVGVTGHQNIPLIAIEDIRRALDAQVSSLSDLIGVCSLAAGADQLFAEVIIRRGGVLNVVVPCRAYETTFSDDADRERYARLRGQAANVVTLDFPSPSEDAFFAAGMQVVDMADKLIAIWDGKQAKGRGGTADVVDYAKDTKKLIVVIWPEGVER